MHSSCFFLGQAIGPIYYGYAFHHFGSSAPPLGSDRTAWPNP